MGKLENTVIRSSAPRIDPVPPGTPRPLWSVMIPAYNCAEYLEQTLRSVLDQDPGPEVMQIEVVDDCSTLDNPQQVVEALGRGRVNFSRQSKNGGPINNFNTCIERSRGELVHILHGDDYVAPGFYDRLSRVAKEHPDLALYIARCFVISRERVIEALSPRLRQLERPSRNPGDLSYTNYVLTPGAVVRRSYYEVAGGFEPQLSHSADWEMWVRATVTGGSIALPDVLGYYRDFPENHTHTLLRHAQNIREIATVVEYILRYLPEVNRQRFSDNVSRMALKQTKKYLSSGDDVAAIANFKAFLPQCRGWRRYELMREGKFVPKTYLKLLRAWYRSSSQRTIRANEVPVRPRLAA